MNEKLYEGYHPESELPFKRGDRVRVKKGATLTSTHPKKEGPYPAYRSQVVTVHHLLPGMSYHAHHIGERERMHLEVKGFGDKLKALDVLRESDQEAWCNATLPVKNPTVVWVGTGNYWVEADINDVELVEDEE